MVKSTAKRYSSSSTGDIAELARKLEIRRWKNPAAAKPGGTAVSDLVEVSVELTDWL